MLRAVWKSNCETPHDIDLMVSPYLNFICAPMELTKLSTSEKFTVMASKLSDWVRYGATQS